MPTLYCTIYSHSITDATAELKDQLLDRDGEIAQLKQMNYELQNEASQHQQQQQLRMAQESSQVVITV